MGLVKTVFSPLTNTTPLVSIILVVLLVAIFRFSGGGISIGEIKNKTSKNSVKTVSQNTVNKDNDYKNLPTSGTIKVNADEFESLLGRRPIKKPTVAPTKDKQQNSLTDIEVELGLRKRED